MERTDALVGVIKAYVDFYRDQQGIQIGSIHVGSDDLSAQGELIEQLARADFGDAPWDQLGDPVICTKLHEYVIARQSLRR